VNWIVLAQNRASAISFENEPSRLKKKISYFLDLLNENGVS
jgi:hypothetical protein